MILTEAEHDRMTRNAERIQELSAKITPMMEEIIRCREENRRIISRGYLRCNPFWIIREFCRFVFSDSPLKPRKNDTE